MTNLRNESTPSAGSLPKGDPFHDATHKLTVFLEFKSARLESRYQAYRFDIFVSTVHNRILSILIPTGLGQVLTLVILPFLIKSTFPNASAIPALSETFDVGLVTTGLLLTQLVISLLVLQTRSSWEVGSDGESNEQEKVERHGKRLALISTMRPLPTDCGNVSGHVFPPLRLPHRQQHNRAYSP